MVDDNLDKEIREILELFDKVEKSEISKIDGQTLTCALRLVFFAGIGKKEISSVKMSDLRLKEGEPIGIDPGSQAIEGKFIHLSGIALDTLKNYLDHLRAIYAEQVSPDKPLFPEYAGQSGMKQLDRHLKKCSESLGFEQIHKLGVKYHETLFRAGQAERPTHEQFRLEARSIKGIITGNIQPAGQPTSIDERLKVVLTHLNEIDRSNGRYISFMDEFIKRKNEILDSIMGDKSLDTGISQKLKEKNVEAIRSPGSLLDPDLRVKPLSSRISSLSMVLHMVEPKDGQEAVEKLIWLLDYIPIIPLSDLQELNIFRDVFFETLSGLALDSKTHKTVYIRDVDSRKDGLTKGEIEDAVTEKRAFTESFYNTFYCRNIVFVPRTSSEKTEISESPVPSFQATVKGYRESLAIGEPDRDLIYFLKSCGDDDLKPLNSYLTSANKNAASADEVAKSIQRVQNILPFPGIRKLVPYKDVLHYVAGVIGANCGSDQLVDRIETQINSRILENLWPNLEIETQKALCGLQAHEMNCLLARAFWRVRFETDLVTDRIVHSIHWTQKMENDICKELKNWSSHETGMRSLYFSAVLQCIVHISLLRQSRPSRPHMRYRKELALLDVGPHRHFNIQRVPIPNQAPSSGPAPSNPALLPMVLP